MWGRYSSKSKGYSTLFFIFLGVVAIVFLLSMAYLLAWVFSIEIESKLYIKMEISDEGRELASFLEAKKTDMSYMEVMGGVFAGKNQHLEHEIGIISETLEYIGKDCIMVYGEGAEPVRKIGECQEKEPLALIECDIAMPGAMSTGVKGKARLYDFE